MRKQGSPEILEERRRIAARTFDRDQQSAEIAIVLDVHPQTVRAWKREYQAGGLKASQPPKWNAEKGESRGALPSETAACVVTVQAHWGL